MAEISMLPIVPTQASAAHILNLLTEAAEQGRNLGSRVPHMQLHARALDRLVYMLDESQRELRLDVNARRLTSPEVLEALAQLDWLAGEVRTLIELVDAFPA
ncbi:MULTISPECIES: hypothetical protein [Methylobacterium]|uniref:Uncharacterized protein n=1 Tax=Methylobacterium radiotolerans TaxID=31998 RepID=A0ABV2NTJ2_9HYPH|nr:hypothetical protein [Methylobacterium sp. PvP109]MBP2506289.1 hypothetical protein [Methylobacterium sp. PvP109]